MAKRSRNLSNPLFDAYVEAMIPYIQRHQHWSFRWAKKNEPEGEGMPLDDLLRWEVGRSPTALDVLTTAVTEAPARTEDELEKVDALISPFRVRHEVVSKLSWAIPTPEAIDKIV
jgi:hypothetical protein